MSEHLPKTEKLPKSVVDEPVALQPDSVIDESPIKLHVEDDFLDDESETLSRKQRAIRTAGKTLLGVIILLLLAIGGGLAYVWHSGNAPAESTVVEQELDVTPFSRQPAQPPADAAVSASIQMLTSPITPGTPSFMTVKSISGASCSIKAEYNNIKSTDPDLIPKTTDLYGVVRWQWRLEQSTPLGDWPVEVTCERNGKSAMVRGTQAVVRFLEE